MPHPNSRVTTDLHHALGPLPLTPSSYPSFLYPFFHLVFQFSSFTFTSCLGLGREALWRQAGQASYSQLWRDPQKCGSRKLPYKWKSWMLYQHLHLRMARSLQGKFLLILNTHISLYSSFFTVSLYWYFCFSHHIWNISNTTKSQGWYRFVLLTGSDIRLSWITDCWSPKDENLSTHESVPMRIRGNTVHHD